MLKLMILFKNILLGLGAAVLVGSIVLELKTTRENKVLLKVIGYCDFNSENFSMLGYIYNYWKFRDVDIEFNENKHALIEGLFALTELKDNGCNTRILKELREIERQGYKYNEYRDGNGRPWIVREVIAGNELTVSWLIELDGFVNAKITNKNSPYKNQDIFELAVSLNENNFSPSRENIIDILNSKKNTDFLC